MNLIKKSHNKYKKNSNYSSHILKFGVYGLKAKTSSVLTEPKIHLLQKLINKLLKQLSKSSKATKCWNRLQVNSTITRLSPESRMGKGKGPVHHKIIHVKPGQILFEFSSIFLSEALIILASVNSQVSFDVKLLKRSV